MQVARTAPDDVLTSAIIPVQPLVDFLTLRAKNDLRKSVIGAEPAFSAVLGAPPRHFLLHSQKYILRNDRFMVVLNVVLRQSAIVLATLLVQEVYGVGLLQECVTHILLVLQYTSHCLNEVTLPAFLFGISRILVLLPARTNTPRLSRL